jgi:FKBP-type peptidyl-prolyl cis-trans isomerase
MSHIRSIFAASAGVLVLAGCEGLPSAPISFGSGPQANPCPTYAAGQVPFTPPLPAACDEMQVTANGLRWIEIAAGDPASGSPNADATVVVSYEAFVADTGRKFDSSFSRGEASVYKLGDIAIEGWANALQRMNSGDEWMLYVPSSQGYGAEGIEGLVPPNADLIFKMRLDGFLTAEQIAAAAAPKAAPAPVEAAVPIGPDMEAWADFFPWSTDRPGVNTFDSGVSYVVLERGNSTSRNAVQSDNVLVHYEGRRAEDGEFFDSSYSRGEPTEFPVGGVIPGFTEILTYMREGDKVQVHIPSDMAYGDRGAGDMIQPGDDLMFQIHLLKILPAE